MCAHHSHRLSNTGDTEVYKILSLSFRDLAMVGPKRCIVIPAVDIVWCRQKGLWVSEAGETRPFSRRTSSYHKSNPDTDRFSGSGS